MERPEFECRRGEDRGAAPMRVGGVWREEVRVRRAGCGDECPAPHWGAVPPPEKMDFASQIGEFWCKLSAFGKFKLIT